MSTSNTVGDLFNTAGRSLVTLSELIKSLHPTADSTSGGKWTTEDVEMLQTAVLKFCDDLNIISQNVKRRSVSQIRSGLKKKAYEDAGLPVRGQLAQQQQSGGLMKSSEVTLNMLNAQESLVDVEGIHEGVKLEFGTSHHEEGTN